MICVAVLEKDENKRALIKRRFLDFIIQTDYELDILWIVDKNPVEKIDKYASKVQLALVSLDEPDGPDCGRIIYRGNPDCRIVYYREKPCPIEPLLGTRPISFYLWENENDHFLEKLKEICREIEFSQTTFRYETRSQLLLLPIRNILYFQSDLRYINIILTEGEPQRILAKLSEIEQLVGGNFVRIHKRYLVNASHVLSLDRRSHMIVLNNGKKLSISDAQYDHAYAKLGKQEDT